MDSQILENDHQLRKLATESRWTELLEATTGGSHSSGKTINLMWTVRALRALSRGHEANDLLLIRLKDGGSLPIPSAIELAEELLQCSYLSEAKPLLEALFKLELPEAHFLRSTFFRECNDWEGALAALEPLRKLHGPWPRLCHISEALIRLRQGWLGVAFDSLMAFENDPTAGIQKAIARLEIAIGRVKDAKKRLEQVSSEHPFDWEWPALLATAKAVDNEDLDECQLLIGKGIARQPRQPEAYALMCRIHLLRGDDENARRAATQALAVKPWMDAALIPFIEQAVSRRDFQKARQILSRGRKIVDTPRRQAAELDILRLEGAKSRVLISLAEQLTNQFKNDPEIMRAVAAAYEYCGRRDKSAVLIEESLRLNPYDRATRNNLAALYKNRGDIDDAILQWQELSDAGDEIAQINLAQTLADRGDLAQAEEVWHRLNTSSPTQYAIVQRGLALLFLSRGDVNDAMLKIREACSIEPRNTLNWLVLADIEEKLRGPAAALKILEDVETRVDSLIKLRKKMFELLQFIMLPSQLVGKVRNWRRKDENEIEYYLLEAKAHRLAEDLYSTEEILKQAVKVDPQEGYAALARFYAFRGRLVDAKEACLIWAKYSNTEVRPWGQLAEICYLERKPDEALEALDQALDRDPGRHSIVKQKIGILLALEKYETAIETARQYWEKKRELSALSLWLECLEKAHQFDMAVQIIEEIKLSRPFERAINLRYARQLFLAGRDEQGIAVLRQAHEREPSSDLVVSLLIKNLMRLERTLEASQIMKSFSANQTDRNDLRIAIAGIAMEQGLLNDAKEILQSVIDKNPESIQGWMMTASVEKKCQNNSSERSIWLEILNRFHFSSWLPAATDDFLRLGMEQELENSLNSWRNDEPNNPKPWWIALRIALKLHRYTVATEMVDGIERRIGQTIETLAARATILGEQNRLSEAIRCIEKATQLAPINHDFLHQLISLQIKGGDWDKFEANFQRLEYLVGDGRFRIYEKQFFNLNCHPDWSVEKLFRHYQDWDSWLIRPFLNPPKAFANSLDQNRKLRIGYVSPDFRAHVVAKFSEPIVQFHDRDGFELFAYAHFDMGYTDNVKSRFRGYFDHWCEIQQLSDDELERTIRRDKIDILVDLAGHTSHHRLSVFARRPAPILASHVIGAGQTTGMSVIDYLIASTDVWPAKFDEYAAERVERLSTSGLIYRVPEDVLPALPLPCLNGNRITFGVFARPVRTNRRTIKVWADILHQVPDSRLRFEHVPFVELDIQSRFIEQFAEHGIGADRLEFNNTRPYWAAFQQIDIQLDPFPAGSGTTATEGLYMERLVVTLRDRPAMGRMAHAQLVALKLDDICSAADEQEYVQKAVALASDPLRLAKLSSGLRQRFENSPITDYKGYANALAATYRRWWKTWCEQQAQSELTQ